MQVFTIKRGDTSPSLVYSLRPTTVSLAAATVRFKMRERGGGATLIDSPAVIVSNSPPVVRFDWAAGQTDKTGQFEAEFEVTNVDETVETFPNRDYIQIRIGEDIPNMV